VIYIQEAHPSDGWALEKNEKEDIVFSRPTSFGERVEIAHSCAVNLGTEFPALIDDIENTTDTAYHAWPDRIYLVGADGRIVYKGGAGPFGFEPDELAEALKQLFPEVSAAEPAAE